MLLRCGYMNQTKELQLFFAIKTVSVYVFLPLSFYILLPSLLVSIFPLLQHVRLRPRAMMGPLWLLLRLLSELFLINSVVEWGKCYDKNISLLKCAFQSVGSGFHLRPQSSLFGSLRFALLLQNFVNFPIQHSVNKTVSFFWVLVLIILIIQNLTYLSIDKHASCIFAGVLYTTIR